MDKKIFSSLKKALIKKDKNRMIEILEKLDSTERMELYIRLIDTTHALELRKFLEELWYDKEFPIPL